jgi:hypothetical protein
MFAFARRKEWRRSIGCLAFTAADLQVAHAGRYPAILADIGALRLWSAFSNLDNGTASMSGDRASFRLGRGVTVTWCGRVDDR